MGKISANKCPQVASVLRGQRASPMLQEVDDRKLLRCLAPPMHLKYHYFLETSDMLPKNVDRLEDVEVVQCNLLPDQNQMGNLAIRALRYDCEYHPFRQR